MHFFKLYEFSKCIFDFAQRLNGISKSNVPCLTSGHRYLDTTLVHISTKACNKFYNYNVDCMNSFHIGK